MVDSFPFIHTPDHSMRPILLVLALLILPASIGCDSMRDDHTDYPVTAEEAFIAGYRNGVDGNELKSLSGSLEFRTSVLAGYRASLPHGIGWQTSVDTAFHWGDCVRITHGFHAGQAGHVIAWSDGMYVVDLTNMVHTPKQGWGRYDTHEAPTLCGLTADDLEPYTREIAAHESK